MAKVRAKRDSGLLKAKSFIEELEDEEKIEECDDELDSFEDDDEDSLKESEDEDEDDDSFEEDDHADIGDESDKRPDPVNDTSDDVEDAFESEDEDDSFEEDEDLDDEIEESEEEEKEKAEALQKVLVALKVPEAQMVEARAVLSALVKESAVALSKKITKNSRKILLERYRRLVRRTEAKVKKYSERAALEFARKNKAAILNAAKAEAASRVLVDISKVLAKHNIDVVPNGNRIRTAYEARRKAISQKYSALVEENAGLLRRLEGMKIARSIENLTDGMTVTDKARFRSMVEALEVKDHRDFIEKAKNVRSKIFSEDRKDAKTEKFVESFSSERKDRRFLGIGSKKKNSTSVLEAAYEVLSS